MYWSIVALQGYVSFCCMAKWVSYTYTGVHAKLLQMCPTLCGPIGCSLPGFSVCGILQARILEWVAISSSRGSSQSNPRFLHLLQWQVSSFPLAPPGKPRKWTWKWKSLSRVRLFATTWTVARPGFSVCGILQAGILERVAISFSRASSWCRD